MLTPRQGCFLLALLLAGPSVSWAQAPATPAADHYNRAVEAISAGRWDQAVDALRQADSADPQDADAHFQLGSAYRESKRPTEAPENISRPSGCGLMPVRLFSNSDSWIPNKASSRGPS